MSHSVTIWRNINVASFFAHDNGTYLWSQILLYRFVDIGITKLAPGLAWQPPADCPPLHYGILLRKYDIFITQYPKEPHFWPRPGILNFSFLTKVFHMSYSTRFLNQLKVLNKSQKRVTANAVTLFTVRLNIFSYSGEGFKLSISILLLTNEECSITYLGQMFVSWPLN